MMGWIIGPLIFLVTIYVFVAIVKAAVSALIWSDFDGSDEVEERKKAAHEFMTAPLWPMDALKLVNKIKEDVDNE